MNTAFFRQWTIPIIGFLLIAAIVFGPSIYLRYRYNTALNQLPIMPGATGIEKTVNIVYLGDSPPDAVLTYHVRANQRAIFDFYYMHFIADNWKELVFYRTAERKAEGRHQEYLKGTSQVVNVSVNSIDYVPAKDLPTTITDQEVTLIVDLVDLSNGGSYEGHQPYKE